MNNKIMDSVYKTVQVLQSEFNARLDAECETVLKAAGITGKITAKKLSKLGYTIVYTPDGAARICKHGKPVSNVIYPLPL